MARRLVARRHEVTHLASAALRSGEEWAVDTPYEVVRVPVWNGLENRGFPFPVPGPSAARELRRRIAATDVIHAHGMLFLPSTIALLQARRAGHRARILTEHCGPFPSKPSTRERVEAAANFSLGRMTARAANAIIVVNPATTEMMRALAPATEVVAIPNGIDAETFRPAEEG